MGRIAGLLLALGLLPATMLPAAAPPDLESLIRGMRSTRPEVRARAAEALGKLGPLAAPAVRSLVGALSDASLPVKLEALIALDHIGPAARAAVPELVKILKSDD